MKRTLVCALMMMWAVAASFAQQKTYNWIAGNDETVSLDPGYYHAGPVFQPSVKVASVHVDVDAQQPVTLAMTSAQDWNEASQRPGAFRNLQYVCVQEHVLKTTYSCTPPGDQPMVMVVRDDRGTGNAGFFGIGEVIARHDRRPADDRAISAGLEAAFSGRPVRQFMAPNNVQIQYYEWSCTENCSLPDPKLFGWVRAESETVRLDPSNYYTSRTYSPGPEGGNMQVDIEARFPITLALVDPRQWTDATEHPTSARNLNNIEYSCVQQHTLRTTYTCHLPGFWPQVLVIRDERQGKDDSDHSQAKLTTNANPSAQAIPVRSAGAPLTNGVAARAFSAPNDVTIQHYSWRCIQACDQPDFGWVQQVREKFQLTNILKVYGGLAADHEGAQVSIKVKSPVPMAVAMLPTSVAGQLYGKPDMFDSAVASSSCQQRGVQSTTFQCTLNPADGPQSLVLVPEVGTTIPNKKKAEVQVQTLKCIDNCNNLPK